VLELSPRASIFAFEPSTVARRDFDPQLVSHTSVEIVPYAVSDTPGSALLWSDKPGSELASLRRRELRHLSIRFDSYEEAEVTTLDVFCSQRNIKPHGIKIDVEGIELSVLWGAIKTLETTGAIQFEFGGTSLDCRTFFKDYFDFFNERNFLLFRMSPTGLIPAKLYSEELERFTSQNWIAVNRKFLGELRRTST